MTGFSTDALFRVLTGLPVPKGYRVAFSGGVDSCALLHAIARLRERLTSPLRAVHVDHGLSPDSKRWALSCAKVCADLSVSLELIELDARHPRGASPEAWARSLRYAALKRSHASGEMLLTAHHLDDQAETVLLQLMRGAGPAGLAAMPGVKRWGPGWLARPLLGYTREALRAYARAERLEWVSDPGNATPRYDRNYLRHEVIPGLKGRWPALATTLGRAAAWQAEAATLIETVAAEDLARLSEGEALSVAGLRKLSAPRRRNVLRHWLRRLGLPRPTAAQLGALSTEALNAAADRCPRWCWPGAEVGRFRDRLYALPPAPTPAPRGIHPWDIDAPLRLPHGELRAEPTAGRGLKAAALRAGAVTVRFRQGGERLRPEGRARTGTLKHLLQEAAVPPWGRGRIPLIYCDEELVAVAGRWIAHAFAAQPDEAGLTLCWRERPASKAEQRRNAPTSG